MAHGQPVLAGLQLSHDAGVGDVAAVVVPCQDRAGVGRRMRCEQVSLGPSVVMMSVAALGTSKW
jgi:hypothetical protein